MSQGATKQIRWDKAKVIKAIRDRRAQGLDINTTAITRSDVPLSGAIRRQFGTHDAALRAARIDPASVRKQLRWDGEMILAALRKRHAKGLPMHSRALQTSVPGLADAIRRYFPSHDAALKAVRINPASVRRAFPWDKAKIIRALQSRRAKGLELHTSAILTSQPDLYGAIQGHFPSHDDAVQAAGIDPATVRRNVRWDQAKVVAALHERRALGLDLNIGAIRKSYMALSLAIYTQFGSHDAALLAAGIDSDSVRKVIRWDKAAVAAELCRRHAVGEPLFSTHLIRNAPKLYSAMKRHFGSCRIALEAAGIDPDQVKADAARPRSAHWTEDRVKQDLRDLHRDGIDLRYRQMKEHNQPLFFAAKELFGSYVNAVRQAGIDYWEMSQAHLARERAAGRDAAGDDH